jgi:hypothetical protein
MARKIQRKTSKEVKSLLIAMLIGDGTISNNYVFKLSHCIEQLEFLNWKLGLLNKLNIKNNGIKSYISKQGYNVGSEVLYSQLSITSTIKALRKSIYIPKKMISRNLLNWLTPEGIAIWYMDDGHININESIQRGNSIQHTAKISTCVTEEVAEEIIRYFDEVYDIKMRKMKEKTFYSISTSRECDCFKFLDLVRPYVEQVPSLLYKIRTSGTEKDFIANSSETRNS